MARNRFYVVQVGRSPGIYSSYWDAQRQTLRFPRGYLKGFTSLAAAEKYFGMGTESSCMPDKLQISTSAEARNSLKVYADGVCRGNGREVAQGGFGVYFGFSDPRNRQGALKGPQQTNQRADLAAVLCAIQLAAKEQIPAGMQRRPVQIYTKSSYVIFCLTAGYQKWVRNGWQTASGAPVKNQDLIADIVTEARQSGLLVSVDHIRKNSRNVGIERANEMAAYAARGAMDNRDINDLTYRISNVAIA
ncbi:ribonuclease H-like protein [Linderina pennispora]|uniref:ribonuclease H n=1 Tax=Linderina pennispora TaxID=61395 RepID=A0A1Y1VX87_9FUNG|nr:ribonuclease H-like protein [Linderina pennispora]ORX65907.1 ribonuclease H-like protein [Linderina pennispora]